MEQFEFFWSGPFSQWHKANFDVSGMTFNCAEQFMMFCKAVLFGDYETAEEIVQETSPAKQKGLGRKVKNFNADDWNKVARKVVYVGNVCKFEQNDQLYNIIMATNGRTIVEASPHDIIWGIGLSELDDRSKQRETWRGKNWLGEVLTRVRNDIRFNEVDRSLFDIIVNIITNYDEWLKSR
jgi:ribA/ribD-fused uncharacterized protein